jgi:hypothetical protein
MALSYSKFSAHLEPTYFHASLTFFFPHGALHLRLGFTAATISQDVRPLKRTPDNLCTPFYVNDIIHPPSPLSVPSSPMIPPRFALKPQVVDQKMLFHPRHGRDAICDTSVIYHAVEWTTISFNVLLKENLLHKIYDL